MTGVAIPADFGRGQARLTTLRGLLDNSGGRAFGILRVAVDVADAQTVTIGSDVFEVSALTIDSTFNVQAAGLPNNADPAYLDMAAHPFAVGDLLRIENEIVRVSKVFTDRVLIQRARCNTAAAAHAGGVDIFNGAHTAGRIPIGVNATLTPTVFTAAFAAEINAGVGTSKSAGAVVAIVINVNTVMIVAKERGVLALATTETLAGAGNAWDAAVMAGGQAASRSRILMGSRVPLAAEVTAGLLYIPVDFTPTAASVAVRVTADGLPKVWDGALTIVPPSGAAPAYVVLNNAGGVDWAVTDTIYYVLAE